MAGRNAAGRAGIAPGVRTRGGPAALVWKIARFDASYIGRYVPKTGKQRRLREVSRPAVKQAAAAEENRRTRRRHAWRLLAICGLILLAYSNSFQSALVFDNASIIGRDPRIREATAHNINAILHEGYRYTNAGDGLYRPLTTLTYLLNYAVLGNGPRPAGYHWVNLAVHEVNVALVYALGIAILGEGAAAWALAAIWGIHPVLTESVTNIVGRADLLAAFGVLAGLLCHLKGASATGRRRWAWLAGIAAAQAVGLFSKENAAVLPGLMLLYDLTRSGRSPWRRRAPGYAALALPVAAFLYLRMGVPTHMQVTFADNPLVTAGFATARITAIRVMGQLTWLFLWPARLSADYSYNAAPLFHWSAFDWDDGEALIALAFLCAALLAMIQALRRRRAGHPMFFFLAFFFIAELPTSNLIITIGSIMAERFLYLPSVGLAGLAVAAALALRRRFPWRPPAAAQAASAALGIACLALGARTYTRNLDWKDELSLWTSAVQVCPESAKAHYNLAKALEVLPGRMTDAIAEYRIALRIYPDDEQAHTNLGNALSSQPGGLPEAIAEYRAALRIAPNSAEPRNDLATALATLPGRLPEAIDEYRTAVRLQPNNAEVHYNLANALVHAPGGVTEAIAEYREALQIDPNHADAHLNLANALSHLPGRLPDAIAEYRAAIRINPGLAAAHINLGNALSGMDGRLPEAAAEYRAALRSDPDNAEAHYDLATVLERMPGGLPDAIAEYRAALRRQPNMFEAHVNLGNALARTPDGRKDAIAEYEAALRIQSDPVVRQMADRLRAKN